MANTTSTIGIDLDTTSTIKNINLVTSELKSSVEEMGAKIESTNESLQALRKEFEAFRINQTKSNALNRATNELVRVRQELEQKFSNYSVVRDTMLGVLQTLHLLRKTLSQEYQKSSCYQHLSTGLHLAL